MSDTDVAIKEFKRLVKSGYRRGHAINLVAEKYDLNPDELASEVAERSSVKKHPPQEEDDKSRIRRIQESGFAIPDEAKDMGIDPALVV